MAGSAFKTDAFVDISDVVCPVTFVKTKVALDELDDNGDGTFEMYIKKVGE